MFEQIAAQQYQEDSSRQFPKIRIEACLQLHNKKVIIFLNDIIIFNKESGQHQPCNSTISMRPPGILLVVQVWNYNEML
jgi:hypothetical protein